MNTYPYQPPPNPFAQATSIRHELPRPAHVMLTIYVARLRAGRRATTQTLTVVR